MILLFLAMSVQAAECTRWDTRVNRHVLSNAPQMDESSGIARGDDDTWFTHDDSGGPAALYAFGLDGTWRGTSEVGGAENRDWEDIAAGPCPGDAANRCLFIGDIGDNDKVRPNVVVYVVDVPHPGEPVAVRASWTLTYPEGPQNAEALLVQPRTGRVYLVTKKKSGRSEIFRLPEAPGIGMLEKVADLDLQDFTQPGPKGSTRLVTAGDWNPDGDRLVLRTYVAVWEWKTDPCNPDTHWGREPEKIELNGLLQQTEAIAYTPDGGLVTTSEGVPMPIVMRACVEQGPPPTACPN